MYCVWAVWQLSFSNGFHAFFPTPSRFKICSTYTSFTNQPLQYQLYLFQKSVFRLVISYFFSKFLLQTPLDIIMRRSNWVIFCNSSLRTGVSPIIPYAARLWIWLFFRCINKGILAYHNTRNMVLANLTYLDSLNRYIVLCYYKALMDI